jgi:hypothetical protein
MKKVTTKLFGIISFLAAAFSLVLLHTSCSNSEPPSAPLCFLPQAVSNSQINLSWDVVEPEGTTDGIKIERSLSDESNYAEIATAGVNVTSFEDIGLESETLYYYRIRAYNESGNSNYSDCGSAFTLQSGYGMCVNKTRYYYCYACSRTQTWCAKEVGGQSIVTATGVEVFDLLDLQLTAPSTMIISFTYDGSADSCYEKPYLEVIAGAQSVKFSFDCNASGNDSISIGITDSQTINDISFVLFSGDWGSSVWIDAITFTP